MDNAYGNFNLEAYYNEYSSPILDSEDNILYDSYSYPSHGVELDILSDDNMKLIYKGSLARNEQVDIFAVVDYIDGKAFKGTEHIPMSLTSAYTYELNLPVRESRCMNISFRDNKDNLDDNSGKKYVFCSHLIKRSHQ